MTRQITTFGLCLVLGAALVGCDLDRVCDCGQTLDNASIEELVGALGGNALDIVTGIFEDD